MENFEQKSVYEMNTAEKRQWGIPRLKNLLSKLNASKEVLVEELHSQFSETANEPHLIPAESTTIETEKLKTEVADLLSILEDSNSDDTEVNNAVSKIENMPDMIISGEEINPREQI